MSSTKPRSPDPTIKNPTHHAEMAPDFDSVFFLRLRKMASVDTVAARAIAVRPKAFIVFV